MADAMLYVCHTGCQWRFLPESFGPWTRVWSQFRRWSRNGTWARALTTLHAAAREVDGRAHATPSMVVIDMVGGVAPLLDVNELVIHVVDHQQRVLVPIMPAEAPERDVIAVDGTVAGRAFSLVTVQEVPGDDAVTKWIPLLDGIDRQGVLQVVAPVTDDRTRRDCAAVATLLAEMLNVAAP